MINKAIYIVGINGNMGTRYKSILKGGGIKYLGHDFGESLKFTDENKIHGFIIVSPTNTHLIEIAKLFKFKKPILCEKPLTLDLKELTLFEKEHEDNLQFLTMINQYRFLYNENSQGETYYNYFKSGQDGLKWDCINIIGLSDNIPSIKNTSPEWLCKINGKKLSLADMDKAYIQMIKEWLINPKSNFGYAKKAHEKVLKWFPF